VGVRVVCNGLHLLVRKAFEGVRQDQLAQVVVAVEGGDLRRDGGELFGYDDNSRLLPVLDEDRVADAPRRARSSVAQADDTTGNES
jgi:hypothetical protein